MTAGGLEQTIDPGDIAGCPFLQEMANMYGAERMQEYVTSLGSAAIEEKRQQYAVTELQEVSVAAEVEPLATVETDERPVDRVVPEAVLAANPEEPVAPPEPVEKPVPEHPAEVEYRAAEAVRDVIESVPTEVKITEVVPIEKTAEPIVRTAAIKPSVRRGPKPVLPKATAQPMKPRPIKQQPITHRPIHVPTTEVVREDSEIAAETPEVAFETTVVPAEIVTETIDELPAAEPVAEAVIDSWAAEVEVAEPAAAEALEQPSVVLERLLGEPVEVTLNVADIKIEQTTSVEDTEQPVFSEQIDQLIGRLPEDRQPEVAELMDTIVEVVERLYATATPESIAEPETLAEEAELEESVVALLVELGIDVPTLEQAKRFIRLLVQEVAKEADSTELDLEDDGMHERLFGAVLSSNTGTVRAIYQKLGRFVLLRPIPNL